MHVPKSAFNCRFYPEYFAGPIYFTTRKAAERILRASKHRKFISVEDILITGIIAGDVGVVKKHLPMIFPFIVSEPAKEGRQILGWHKLKSNLQYEEEFNELRNSQCIPCKKLLKSFGDENE
uniref:Hexosyltransferase n=1 Tax=Caenorhabditis japonica TaxID=281687 RepID=A0A8R1ECH5_CAEJA